MKKRFRKVISLVLVVCTVFTTGILGSVVNASAAGGFEEDNSYLTKEEYQSLELDVGSAESYDHKNKLTPDINGAKLVETKYGWSNPQVLAVMASAPYWSELKYGDELTSPGSTSFTVSTSTTENKSANVSIELGVSVTSSVTTEGFGNGVKVGGTATAAFTAAQSVQKEKTVGTSHTFTAGAGEDYVALMVFPVASYKYEYKVNGTTQYYVVNIQLDPVYGMTTLDVYNTVARNHNQTETSAERMMPVIELDELIEGYETGDPSTCPSDVSEIPTSLNVAYGDWIIDKSCYVSSEETGDNQIKGTVYTEDEYVSVGVGNTCMDQTISFSESSGSTIESGVMLGVSVFAEVTAGADVGIVKAQAARSTEFSAAVGASCSFTTINTNSIEYTMSFASLPSSAVTGTNSLGIGTTPYAFNTKLAVWVPENTGEKVLSAPVIILPVVKFDEGKTLPPELPRDFYVESVTDTSVTFKFNTSLYLYSERFADTYKIMIKTTGSTNDNYVLYEQISANLLQYQVNNLKPGTEYTFALKSVAADGTESALSAPVTINTSTDQSPVIKNQPKTLVVDEGDEPIFTVIPEGNIDDYCYQWERMTEDKYGIVWTPVSGATENVFNAAYYSEEGKVDSVNRYDLADSAYRCVVTDKSTGVNVITDTVVLYISNDVLIDSYDELKQIAYRISVGDTDYIYRNYNLGCDIVFPEGEVWTIPFGTSEHPYQGEFDGKGHTIQGFTFDNSNCECSGFFGCTKNAEINNLTLKDSVVTGGKYTGALIGKTTNTIVENCYVTGNNAISGTYEVGGIVGDTGVNSYFVYCYAQGSLDNQNPQGYTGGIAGNNYGSEINSCVCRCSISGKGTQGGIAGFNLCRIVNSFFDNLCFTGSVSGKSVQSVENNTKGVSTEEIMSIIDSFLNENL